MNYEAAALMTLAAELEAMPSLNRDLEIAACRAFGLPVAERDPPFATTCAQVFSNIVEAGKTVPTAMTWLISSNLESGRPFYAAVEFGLNTWDASGFLPLPTLCAASLRAKADAI